MFLQLLEMDLSTNQLDGSLPETWSNLTSVSPDFFAIIVLLVVAVLVTFIKELIQSVEP